MHIIHKWTKWKFDRHVRMHDEYDNHHRTDTRFFRKCEKCGKPQVKMLKGEIKQFD